MKYILKFVISIYYFFKASFKIWRVKSNPKDDVVFITQSNTQIGVYPGKKAQSPFDFIVKFKEPNKRERTPAHVHIVVEMYVKHAHNPSLTLQLKEHILTILSQIQPINSFPPRLQFYKPEHVEPFKDLDSVGEFSVEFLLVVTELLAIQEKTNYPRGSLTERLYQNFGVKDRFSVIQSAVWKG